MKTLILILGSILLGTQIALAAHVLPSIQWDHPDPMDPRIAKYTLHCTDSPPIMTDGSHVVATVPVSENSVDINGVLAMGKSYDCVATSNSGYLQSAPSNQITVDLSDIPSPFMLRIKIIMEISPQILGR